MSDDLRPPLIGLTGRARRASQVAGLPRGWDEVPVQVHLNPYATKVAEAGGLPVTLTTAAKGTSFYVDSRRVGTGSTAHESLPPGYHQIQAVHPSGARWQKYLSFDAGEDRTLIIHW